MTLHPAYIAGFFDGEGHVGYHHHNHPHITIAQRDRRPLDAILEAFPGGHIYFRQNKTGDCYNLVYNGKKALPILNAMSDFLIVKWDEVQTYLALIS